jgi:molybdate transport system substrate-binding protein
MRHHRYRRIALLASAMLFLAGAARAKDVVVLCSTGLQSVMEAVRSQYEAQSGDRLVITFDTSNLLKAKLDAGAPFDLAILTPGLIADLVKQGRVVEGSGLTVARAGVGIGVLKGAAKPDISTVEALKAALLATPSIAYTTSGQSGQAFVSAIETLGIADAIRAKAHTIPGGPAGALVVRGEAAMAVQLVPELMAVDGIEVVGPLPAALQSTVVLTAGIGTAATDRPRAEALLKYLRGPEAIAVIEAKGLEPG